MKILHFFGLVSFDENGNEYIEKTDRYALISLASIILITFIIFVSGLIVNGWINNDYCIDSFVNATCQRW